MQSLLQIWRDLSHNEALELLDYQYADKLVRAFAVRCLKVMRLVSFAAFCLAALCLRLILSCDILNFRFCVILQKITVLTSYVRYFFMLPVNKIMLERLHFILGGCVGEGTQNSDRIVVLI